MIRPLLVGILSCCALLAQSPNTLVSEAKFPWTVVRDNLLKMAEKMPAENYAFQPTPEIESFGRRMAHIAGANLFVCQGVMGHKTALARPTATTKPELIALLKQASMACDSAFDSLSDAAAMEKIESHLGGPFPPDATRTKLATLNNMVRHSNEVYGYMCVYLRLKGIVPPSTARE
ncbi:MAG TPA: DinB family protein [Bryobacteraceae bacterium]|nr:DinB family protein [Bryobacteraceae bacterium]